MDFDFTSDQEQLRDAVRRYIDKSYRFDRRRAIINAGGFDHEAHRALADLGITGLRIPSFWGGTDLGLVEAMIALEELGRGITLEPVIQSFICSELIREFASEETKQSLLPGIASGETICTLALQERGARYDVHNCQTVATRTEGRYALTGTKNIVPVGDVAHVLLVPAILDGAVSMFLVERHTVGASTHGYLLQDGGRGADLRMEGARALLITTFGTRALQLAQDYGVAYTCAYAVGVLDKTLETTVNYLKTRQQFGQALAKFQVVRHRLAEMKMQLELARSMSYYVTMKLTSPDADRTRAAAQAKCQLGQSMRFIGQQAVQLHGGIGLTDEYILSHYFKTLTQLEMTFGDSLYHLGRVSERLDETSGVFG